MNFDPGERAREAERRASEWLAAEARAIEASPELDAPGLRRLVLGAQAALTGDAGGAVAARLAVARASPALLLAVDATRLLRDLAGRFPAGALPGGEAAALAHGERVGAVAAADAAGSAPARLVRTASGWRLTARKGLVANGPIADWIAVLASDADGAEVACLVSPRDEGVRVGPRLALSGLDALAASALSADGAPVPDGRVLGPPAGGAAAARYRLGADLSAAIAAAGLVRSALAAATRHARATPRDGRPLLAHQEVSFPLADVLALGEAAELLCHRAAWLAEAGDPAAPTVVRCAKVFCADAAERAASACVQVMGGEGYRRGGVADRAWRDAKGLALAATTTEVARMEIADALLSR
ncbi:MAG TPA: acyl-CoA dehydrogenase family protein [Anaeromyxobacter sp.]|nr:acyl-CoA dehydrogenase family protein [Anaeromyxobacter sp.]